MSRLGEWKGCICMDSCHTASSLSEFIIFEWQRNIVSWGTGVRYQENHLYTYQYMNSHLWWLFQLLCGLCHLWSSTRRIMLMSMSNELAGRHWGYVIMLCGEMMSIWKMVKVISGLKSADVPPTECLDLRSMCVWGFERERERLGSDQPFISTHPFHHPFILSSRHDASYGLRGFTYLNRLGSGPPELSILVRP